MAALNAEQLVFVFGLLGNIVSFMVYLAPLPTFYRIYKMKSTEQFQSVPYLVALFSASLTLYYGFLKPNGFMIVTINAIGCGIEAIYVTLYLIFALKKIQLYTVKLLFLFNVGAFGLILTITFLCFGGSRRITAVGWICAVFSVCVYAAPLSIMKQVIATKSVEYMPFMLSFFLTLCATTWFFYGLLIKDYYIALPNTLGFLFGVTQMILHIIFKNANKKDVLPMKKMQEVETTTKVVGENSEVSQINGRDLMGEGVGGKVIYRDELGV